MAIANVNLPRILRVGAGASQQVSATLVELGLQNPLLVTDPFMVECGYSRRIEELLEVGGIDFGLFAECVPDPTTDSVYAALAALREGGHDCVVALGGGSSMDTAKAAAVLMHRDGPMRDYKVPFVIDSGLPVIAIPTTAGTGSEATRVAVISDTETQEKMLCMGLGLMPIAALVDFELTLTMPYRLTADTGLDSLCHALEAYVSRKSNPFTDSVALTAMRTIFDNIRGACDEPDNRAAREAMMLAATQGGIAFANASVTLIHGMSRPIGALYHVPHGMSNAMLLPEITAWSVSHSSDRYVTAPAIWASPATPTVMPLPAQSWSTPCASCAPTCRCRPPVSLVSPRQTGSIPWIRWRSRPSTRARLPTIRVCPRRQKLWSCIVGFGGRLGPTGLVFAETFLGFLSAAVWLSPGMGDRTFGLCAASAPNDFMARKAEILTLKSFGALAYGFCNRIVIGNFVSREHTREAWGPGGFRVSAQPSEP